MRKFGLIGKKLGHSFSKKYFTAKFEKEDITDTQYDLYELQGIGEFKELIAAHKNLVGLNVTIPYKKEVLPLLDELDEAVLRIGAVNTIKIQHGKTKGFNTDYIGFKNTLKDFYPIQAYQKALVLGTGGAAQAVFTALEDLGIPFTVVSRKPKAGEIRYSQVTADLLQEYNLIVNTTPLGMEPHPASFPDLPYQALTASHYLYDLVYNPEQTQFLQKGIAAGAQAINGLPMLYAQAEAAWQIWNS